MATLTACYYLVIEIRPGEYQKVNNRPAKKKVRFGLIVNARPGMSEADMAPLLQANEEFCDMYTKYNPSDIETPRIRFAQV